MVCVTATGVCTCWRVPAAYTHLDGKVHRRVPFGVYKIDASRRAKSTRSDHDVRTIPTFTITNGRELGLVSFAGYQLRIPGGETLGVLAVFAKHPILPAEDRLLDGLSSTLAFVVRQAVREEGCARAKSPLSTR